MDKKIMIVDDETMITSTLSSLIKVVLNISVITYNEPEMALQSHELNNNDIHLIISDFMMPGMNGLNFLKRAREKSPNAV
ncbi:MAG: response regulator, partial [bacterium]